MAGIGPLPTGEAARRNKPAIPTTQLPASGRKGRVPKAPVTYELGPAAKDWWAWAWHTPQACGWDDGQLFTVARRAQLEDDLVALAKVDVDIAELLGLDKSDATQQLESLISQLKSLAGGRIAVIQKMNDLDATLGLTPKGREALRWKIVADEEPVKATGPAAPTGRKGLTLVDKAG